MTKESFLFELETKIRHLPKDERDAALQYYREYFQEAGPEHEQDVIDELKSPSHIASKILADYAVKDVSTERTQKKSPWRAFWFTILALCAAPTALPVLIAGLILIFVLIIVFGAMGIVFFVCAVAFFVGGIVMLFVIPVKAILMIGSAFIFVGVAIIFISGLGKLISFIGTKLKGEKK